MSEYRRNRRNKRSNEQKKKRRLSMSRRDEFNSDLVYVSVDGSHRDLGRHKGIYFVVVPKRPTVDLTATSDYDLFLVDTNDEKYQNYQLSTADDEKNDKTKYSIDPA